MHIIFAYSILVFFYHFLCPFLIVSTVFLIYHLISYYLPFALQVIFYIPIFSLLAVTSVFISFHFIFYFLLLLFFTYFNLNVEITYHSAVEKGNFHLITLTQILTLNFKLFSFCFYFLSYFIYFNLNVEIKGSLWMT
jgi:hypothetical protein